MVDIYDYVKINNCTDAPELNGVVAVVRNVLPAPSKENTSYILWANKECLGEFTSDEFVLVSSPALI